MRERCARTSEVVRKLVLRLGIAGGRERAGEVVQIERLHPRPVVAERRTLKTKKGGGVDADDEASQSSLAPTSAVHRPRLHQQTRCTFPKTECGGFGS